MRTRPPKKTTMPAARGRVLDDVLFVLRGWSVNKDGWLHGRVYNRPGVADGTPFETSPIIGVRHRLAVTQSGSHYYLSTPETPDEAAKLLRIVGSLRRKAIFRTQMLSRGP